MHLRPSSVDGGRSAIQRDFSQVLAISEKQHHPRQRTGTMFAVISRARRSLPLNLDRVSPLIRMLPIYALRPEHGL